MFKKRQEKKVEEKKNIEEQPKTSPEKTNWVEELSESNDFVNDHTSFEKTEPFWISYFRTLVMSETLYRDVVPYLSESDSLEKVKNNIPIQQTVVTSDTKLIKEKLLQGFSAIRIAENDIECLLVNVANSKFRDISFPMMESTALGPQAGYVEEMDTNINLIRKHLPSSDLHVKEMQIGKLSSTKIAVIYIDSIADKDNVETVLQRINDVQYDHISDSSYLASMIEDNTNSLFPQIIPTERTDRTIAALTEGKIVIVVDGSPDVLIAPITLAESVVAMEDYYVPWLIANYLRLIRLFGLCVSIVISPLYIAVLTYHYELIPAKLLDSLVASRAAVPFPPIIEVLILEISVEFIKESSLRLPTKIGTTLGIVGGIVIGQAIVEAKLTSSVLIILIGLSTLASYTSAIYKFNNSVRLVKYPIIVLAQFLGLIGIVIGLNFLLAHLLRLTSLGRPYIGFYPFRMNMFKDLWIRLPFSVQKENPDNLRPQVKQRAVFDRRSPGPPSDFDE
ncbi:spore germination protein [Fictibacillus phosphorivorans]|uniref:spore germination protein n=2 Tax=Fictibacillus TaxID=1329200 RepID=UPI003CF5C9A3